MVLSQRTSIGLYTDPDSADSHRVRLVLAEKGIDVEIVEVLPDGPQPEDLADLNPYAETPTLVDRDLALYDPRVICEYLDERFPHPPLMPVDPVSRAKAKLVISRVERDWYRLLSHLERPETRGKPAVRRELAEGLAASADVFDSGLPYFLSEEITMMDCTLAPPTGVSISGRNIWPCPMTPAMVNTHRSWSADCAPNSPKIPMPRPWP